MLAGNNLKICERWIHIIGLCAEFPSLSWLTKTHAAALSGIRRIAADVVADLAANGESMPDPLAGKIRRVQ